MREAELPRDFTRSDRGWPDSFYDYTLELLSVPAPEGVSAAQINAGEVRKCGHPTALMIRWFDLPSAPPEG